MNAILHCPTPPADRPFMASGNTVEQDGAFSSVEPFAGRVEFSCNGELVWSRNRMSVRMCWDAEIHLLEWSLGMDGWQLVELDGRTTGYVHPETARAVATLEELPEHVQAFLSRESQEGRR